MNARLARRIYTTLAAAGSALLLWTATVGAEAHRAMGDQAADPSCEIKLDLNRATLAELENIPGIRGPAAFGIMDYRDTHGSFGSLEEVMRAKDVDAQTFAILRDRAEVVPESRTGSTYATADGAYVWSCKGS